MPLQKMQKTIEHLRNQSDRTKHVTALTVAIAIGALLAILWGISIVSPKFNITSSDIRAFNPKTDPLIRSLQTGFDSMTRGQNLNETTDTSAQRPALESKTTTYDESSPYYITGATAQ